MSTSAIIIIGMIMLFLALVGGAGPPFLRPCMRPRGGNNVHSETQSHTSHNCTIITSVM